MCFLLWCDPNGSNPDVCSGWRDIAKLLLDNGADYTIRNHNGITPLQYALANTESSVALLFPLPAQPKLPNSGAVSSIQPTLVPVAPRTPSSVEPASITYSKE